MFGSTYKSVDLNKIIVNVVDEHSGINYNSIAIKVDGENLFYDYIPYRKMIRCELDENLLPGSHLIEIYIEDNLNNSIYKKGTFFFSILKSSS